MRKPNLIIRNNRGISIILLVITLATLLLAVDFFVFNFVRILMIQRQITGVCEAASLAGTSILARLDASNDDINHKKLAAAQIAACRCAENMVLRGHILGKVLDKAMNMDELTNLGKNLKPDSCQYVVTVADPDSSYTPVDFGNPNGKTISCYITYGYKPAFMDFLNSVCYAVTGNCVSGLPQIDSVLVLDLSASMDDQTVVTFVRREWIHSSLGLGDFAMGKIGSSYLSGASGIIQYVSLYCPTTPHTLANYLGWNGDAYLGTEGDGSEVVDGSLVNVLPPQNLDKTNNDPHKSITHPMYFDAYLRSHYSHYNSKSNLAVWEATPSPYCRALDYGTPPGNCDLSVSLGGNGDGVSDMLGNMATSLGPGGHPMQMPPMPGVNNSNTSYPSPTTAPIAAVPPINAFSDLNWQNDNDNYFGYQPSAPGALESIGPNDPIPSPNQQTFTDLVVNIVNPNTAKSRSGSISQPLIGPDYFMGFSYTFPSDDPDPLLRNQTFNFPNIAVVVEAARGNLESTSVLPNGLKNAQAALINRLVSVDGTIFNMASIEPKDGYQRAYQRLAMLVTQPLASVLAAIDNGYLQKLHKFADCRFGLVSFSSAGSISGNHTSTFGTLDDKSADLPHGRSFYIFCSPYGNADLANPVYDCGLPTAHSLNDNTIQDGSGFGFRIPRVPLNVNSENYLECASKNKLKQAGPTGETMNICLNAGSGSNGIFNCRAESLTDSGEALQTAHNMFHSNTYDLGDASKCRQTANKLIVFFTDGEPTGGISGKEAHTMLQAAGEGNSGLLSNSCEADGIAIVSVSLNLAKNKAYNRRKEHQLLLLDDKSPQSGELGGIAWRAGHGSRYYSCKNLSELETAFADIARHFTQSQR